MFEINGIFSKNEALGLKSLSIVGIMLVIFLILYLVEKIKKKESELVALCCLGIVLVSPLSLCMFYGASDSNINTRQYILDAKEWQNKIDFNLPLKNKEYNKVNQCVNELFYKDFKADKNTIDKEYKNYLLKKYDDCISKGLDKYEAIQEIKKINRKLIDDYSDYVLSKYNKNELLEECMKDYKQIAKID